MAIPELVAHRGYPRHYPENTIVGIEGAIAAGARYVEVDVQLTADQVPVLFHDNTLLRVCGVAGAVAGHSYEQLREFRAAETGRFGHKFAQVCIPALAELRVLLQRHPAVTAFVELKRTSLERFGIPTVLARVLRELKPVLAQCVPISYSLEAVAAARSQWPAVGVVLDRWRERRQPIIEEIRPEYLFCDVAGLPWFGSLRGDPARVVVYEVTDPRLALKLAGRGVDFIETFAVGELREQIELLSPGP
jgi:glycerophosphoryl diester phosphodiesterase